jgi:Rieske Fe-S protein
MTTEKFSRRTLGGLAAAGVSVPLLAACSSNDPDVDATDPAGSTGSAGSTASPGGGQALASTSDIEVGGGQVFADQEVVVTQPEAGTFKCFTAVCSHQGCIVAEVSDGTINCDCHGSQYSIEDGSVVTGPATFPLAEEKIAVSGDSISLA